MIRQIVFTSLLATTSLPAQCSKSQGPVHLFLSGLTVVGSNIRVGIDAPTLTNQIAVLGLDISAGPIMVPGWGTFCLGPQLFALPARIPATGTFVYSFKVPDNPGLTVYLQGLVANKTPPGSVSITNGLAMTILRKDANITTVYDEDFEAGQGPWIISNAIWEVGKPTVPPKPWAGSKCLGTVLNGDFPLNANSTALSPVISLPSANIPAGEQIRLLYRMFTSTHYWQHRATCRVLDVAANSWSDIADHYQQGLQWTQVNLDLTAYQGKTIRIAYLFRSDNGGRVNRGVYIDNVHVFKGRPVFNNPEKWDSNAKIGNWWGSSNGIWQVGQPSQPSTLKAYSSPNCLGTNLSGNFPLNANSRFVGPSITLPKTGTKSLRFHTWYKTYYPQHTCLVQISENGPTGPGPFKNILDPLKLGSGIIWGDSLGKWTQRDISLAPYAGKTIRIGFQFQTDSGGTLSHGVFIDDIEIR